MTQKLKIIFSWAGHHPGLFFLAYAILMSLDLIILQENCLINGHDSLELAVPHFTTLSTLIKQYGFIGWFPHWGGGLPVLNYFSAWWRPDNLWYFVLTPFWVYVVQFIMAKLIAGWGAFKYFQVVDGYHPLVCLSAGLLFAGNPFFVHEATSVAGIPLFLYCFDRLVLNVSPWKRMLFLAGCFYYLTCCNFILVQPYVTLFHLSLCWLFVRSGRYPLKAYTFFFGFWILYTVIQLPIVMNLLVEYSQVKRSDDLTIASIPVDSAIANMFSHYNIFITSLILLSFIDFFKRRRTSLYHFWFLAVIPFLYLWQFGTSYIPQLGHVNCRISWILPFLLVGLLSIQLQKNFDEN